MQTFFSHVKYFVRYLLLMLLLFTQLTAAAQKKSVFFGDSLFSKYTDTSVHGYDKNSRYYLINTNKNLREFKLIRQLSSSTAIIAINDQNSFDSLKRFGTISAANNEWKLSPGAERKLYAVVQSKTKIILSGVDFDSLQRVLKSNYPVVEVLSDNQASRSVIVFCSAEILIKQLLPLKEITFADVAETAHAETGVIGYDRSFHGINLVDFSMPGANGNNIVAGVKEQQMDGADIDLYKRILPSSIAAPNITNHATVIASLIGGAGNSYYDGRGIANGCHFFPSSFTNLFADDSAVLSANKVTVQNHSYGTVIQQFYGAEALSYDQLVWGNKIIVPVFSAGNQGDAAATEGSYANIPGYANLTGNFKMAKNVITVGSVDNSGIPSAESSAGPLYDGRIAPQLTALGPNGTSDAAAIVTGTIAVMQQVYADSNHQALPPASLIKAILYTTAEDIFNSGIDYKTGYGLLDSYASVKAIQQKKYEGSALSQNETWSKIIKVPANAGQVKITLAWTDSAASVNNSIALFNDLDMQVEELSTGKIYLPWVLNNTANKDSLTALPVRKRDSLNTAEQVSILLPPAGNYQVRVTGTSVPNGPVPFNIAYSFDTLNTFYFISPVHAADIDLPGTSALQIKWKSFVADTSETGNLYISYNNGNSWQLIASSQRLAGKGFRWMIKDTASVAQFEMETSFGNFFSTPCIISRVTSPAVDFVCADSFRLSWNKHVYADSYNIYALTNNPYLQQVLKVTDSFVVLRRSLFPSKVYAIEPVLNNGLPAARSVAVDIEQQGVQCFYRTLNYNLLDDNKLKLILELSIASYADSVVFEQVSESGRLLKAYGSLPVSNSSLIYNLFVDDLSSGVTYLRGRILLKSGATVYTNIIPVLTSGKKSIVFYPNPAQRNNSLRYVLKQGISQGSRLLLYDASGRLLKSFSSLPDNINLSGFGSGIVIYKLISPSNEIIQTGKLIIR